MDIKAHIETLVHEETGKSISVREEVAHIGDQAYPRFVSEFWTSRQRQASPLHEIAYRACFKPQLPRFFIKRLTREYDTVYDPFSGRGTTIIEAALLNRKVTANDINPLSQILAKGRLTIPSRNACEERLEQIPFNQQARSDTDLSMFYHPGTEGELVSLKNYLEMRKQSGTEDHVDRWIRMIATNRLSGHSSGFFSVYTLPPNQAVSPERQLLINRKRRQTPPYRDVKKLIAKKSRSLTRGMEEAIRLQLNQIAESAVFLESDARHTPLIPDETVQLTVTSPPFLDVVQYHSDNWLRCWFNNISTSEISSRITMSRNLHNWSEVMAEVFIELYRITKPGGWVIFEVGEVRNGRIKLEETVVPLGKNAGFECRAILINTQSFTKTSNIWGIKNNSRGTNSNRIVIFQK